MDMGIAKTFDEYILRELEHGVRNMINIYVDINYELVLSMRNYEVR